MAVDYRDRMPAVDGFFNSGRVGPPDRKKMHAALRMYSRSGPSPSKERFERFGDLHYIKIHAFRAYCFERRLDGVRELIVCHIYPKKTNKSLPAEYQTRARTTFHQHCERYC